jgi:Ca2+-transporting ATPase
MGPTCSIIYENEPIEKNAMQQSPRPFNKSFFNFRELGTSIIQGLIISIGVLSIYQFAVHQTYDESVTRTMVFLTLISANIFLTLVNRSFYYSLFTTLRYKNNLVPLIILLTIGLTAGILLVPVVADFFEFKLLDNFQFTVSVFVGFISVVWYEVVKAAKRKTNN